MTLVGFVSLQSSVSSASLAFRESRFVRQACASPLPWVAYQQITNLTLGLPKLRDNNLCIYLCG